MIGKKVVRQGDQRGHRHSWAFAKEGVDVAICARRKGPREAAAAEISQPTSRQIVPIVADLTKPADAENFVGKAHAPASPRSRAH
jgi:short-subunit dehydrogenase